MKKLFVTADDLFLKLSLSPTHNIGETKSSFSIKVKFIESGDILEGRLVLYNTQILLSDNSKTLLSFTGAMSMDEKESVLFTGICEEGEGYENCYLLLAEPADIVAM